MWTEGAQLLGLHMQVTSFQRGACSSPGLINYNDKIPLRTYSHFVKSVWLIVTNL